MCCAGDLNYTPCEGEILRISVAMRPSLRRCRSPRGSDLRRLAGKRAFRLGFARSSAPPKSGLCPRFGRCKRSKSLPLRRRKNTAIPDGIAVFLAEMERFELSRRFNPTYTLSRGASSANLSTSPYAGGSFNACPTIILNVLENVKGFLHFSR